MRTHRLLHVPPVLVHAQADRGVQTPLHVPFVDVNLEQLEPRLGRELLVERALERVLGFLAVVQSLRELAEDLPLGTRLPVRQVLRLEVRDFCPPDGKDSQVL